jgi:hypothetical protein
VINTGLLPAFACPSEAFSCGAEFPPQPDINNNSRKKRQICLIFCMWKIIAYMPFLSTNSWEDQERMSKVWYNRKDQYGGF